MNALLIQDLHARHGRREVLRGAGLHVPAGSITALLGQNGSGKSTLMRAVLGLHPGARGVIQILDLPSGVSSPLTRQHAALVPTGGVVMARETARTHFAFGGRVYKSWNLARALSAAATLHVPLDQPAGRLSTGQRMGLAVAYAFGSGSRLLLLDEPTNGLDPEHREQLAGLLAAYAAEGHAVLLSSHVLPEVEGLADRAVFLRNGRVILEADLDELRAQHAVVQVILPDVLPAGGLRHLETVPGVERLDVQGRTLTLHVRGPREPILVALGLIRPIDVQIKPRPLSEAYADLLGGAA